MAMERTRIGRHVRRDPHLPAAKGEAAAADPVRIGHERKTAHFEHRPKRPFGAPQDWPDALFRYGIEAQDTAAEGGHQG